MPAVFLSYRREDSAGYAGRLFDRLSAQFGADNVFMDVDTIRPGEDFAKVIDERIARCDVMLALIGRDWLTSRNPNGGRRLDDSEDFVRLEIMSAMNRGLTVIPVLVEEAPMPAPNELPSGLERLCRLQAFSLSNIRFHEDVQTLVEAVERYAVSPLTPTISSRPKRSRWGAAAASLFGVGLLLGLVWANFSGPLQRSPPQSANFSGRWVAQVPVPKGQPYLLKLQLELSDGHVLGRVEYPAGSGGIIEGRVERDHISFVTVHQPQFSERQVTTRFEGTIEGEEMELVMQYDDVVKRIRARRGGQV